MAYLNEQEIIQKADSRLMDVISACCKGITFISVGKVKQAKCPFFTEEDTRFYVWQAKQCWICYGGINERGGALQFIMRFRGCDRRTALSELEAMFSSASHGMKARLEKVDPVTEYVFEENEAFSDEELRLLGNLRRNTKKDDGTFEEADTITSEALMRAFPIRSLKSFTRPAREGENYSWRICSTDEFPIMCWSYQRADGSAWGKIYQPKADKGNRFSYFGAKEHNFIFGDTKTSEYINRARKGEAIESENKIKELVIVSGGSDAINAYFNGGFNVCWLNSETDILDVWQERRLRSISKSITVLYDLDDTGKKNAYRMALRYMNIKLAMLPLEMYKDSKGTCKDIKDFFMKWNTDEKSNTRRQDYFYMDKFKRFSHIINNALPLKFWMDKTKEEGEADNKEIKVIGKEIDNEQLYRFLSSLGIHKYAYDTEKSKFIKITNNTVEEIGDDRISGYINQILRDFIKNSPEHFDKQLLNTINRSNQVKGQSLNNISEIKIDFDFDAKTQDYFFFRNGALRITKYEMELVPLDSLPFYLYKDKIKDFDFKLEKEPLFNIEYSEEYITDKSEDTFPLLDRFAIKRNWKDFSYAQFVYNTGDIYWYEKEQGISLTENQQKEEALNFVNKITALGYICRKRKDMKKAYAVFCVEDENNKNGEHNGGVGKSLFYYPLRHVRDACIKDGQLMDPKKDGNLMYSGVVPGKTDIVQFEDLQRGFPLHMIFNQITGDTTVRNLYKDTILIPFHKSPVTIINSNHKPSDIDKSKRRRVWFCTFSNYYHTEDPMKKMPRRDPSMEFGKNLVVDYTPEEMNKLYHFFAQCIQTYMHIDQMVAPVMDRVEKGMLINSISQNVFDWMNDYFDEAAEMQNRLNVAIWRNDIFEDFKQVYSRTVQDRITVATLKDKLQKYCDFKHWTLNPDELYRNDSELTRAEYRKSRNGKDDFFWYIQTKEIDDATRTQFSSKLVVPVETIQTPAPSYGYSYRQEQQQPPVKTPKQYNLSDVTEEGPF